MQNLFNREKANSKWSLFYAPVPETSLLLLQQPKLDIQEIKEGEGALKRPPCYLNSTAPNVPWGLRHSCVWRFFFESIAIFYAPVGNPCEASAPEAMDTITACLRRNRLGLSDTPLLETPTKVMGGLGTPPTTYHTVQPFGSATSPESKEGGSSRRVLQTSDKENWALSTGKLTKLLS